MIASLVAAAVLVQPAPSAADLLSRMFARYAAAQTLVGRIQMVNSYLDLELSVAMEVQYRRPNQLYVRQTAQEGTRRTTVVTYDGTIFTYDVPQTGRDPRQGLRAVETSIKPGVDFMEIGDVWTIARLGLIDRECVPLDILIAQNSDLLFVRGQWATLAVEGPERLGSKDTYRIVGDWRAHETLPVTGRFLFNITEDGELVRYVQDVPMGAETGQAGVMRLEYLVNVEIDAEVKPELFDPIS